MLNIQLVCKQVWGMQALVLLATRIHLVLRSVYRVFEFRRIYVQKIIYFGIHQLFICRVSSENSLYLPQKRSNNGSPN